MPVNATHTRAGAQALNAHHIDVQTAVPASTYVGPVPFSSLDSPLAWLLANFVPRPTPPHHHIFTGVSNHGLAAPPPPLAAPPLHTPTLRLPFLHDLDHHSVKPIPRLLLHQHLVLPSASPPGPLPRDVQFAVGGLRAGRAVEGGDGGAADTDEEGIEGWCNHVHEFNSGVFESEALPIGEESLFFPG